MPPAELQTAQTHASTAAAVAQAALDKQLFDAANAGRTAEVQRLLGACAAPDGHRLGSVSPRVRGYPPRVLKKNASPYPPTSHTPSDVPPLSHHLATQRGRTTALVVASNNGHGDVVTILLAAGADTEATTSGLETALIRAANNGHAQITAKLLAAGAELEAMTRGLETALVRAAFNGHREVVQILLHEHASTEASGAHGHTPLLWASYQGYADVATMLLDAGAATEAKDVHGNTALIAASAHGHLDVVSVLLEADASTHARDNQGRTALMAACSSCSSEDRAMWRASIVLLLSQSTLN